MVSTIDLIAEYRAATNCVTKSVLLVIIQKRVFTDWEPINDN
jgi:hypothetical protein